MTEKHAGGRPLLWKTPEALQKLIDAYFEHCKEEKKPLTICGLGVFLGCDRHTINNYTNRDEFFTTIKKTREKIEAYAEERLFGNTQVAGVIFNMKNNYGWVDKQNIEHEGEVALTDREERLKRLGKYKSSDN